MLECQQNCCRFVLNNIRKMTDELTEADMGERPAPGTNPPRWILGHMAISADYGLKTLGQPTNCPKEWHAAFGPDFALRGPRLDLKPSRDELLTKLFAGYEALIAAANSANADTLAKANGQEFFRDTPIQTIGDAVSHLMTTHLALHSGQLSYWRRCTGRPPLF